MRPARNQIQARRNAARQVARGASASSIVELELTPAAGLSGVVDLTNTVFTVDAGYPLVGWQAFVDGTLQNAVVVVVGNQIFLPLPLIRVFGETTVTSDFRFFTRIDTSILLVEVSIPVLAGAQMIQHRLLEDEEPQPDDAPLDDGGAAAWI